MGSNLTQHVDSWYAQFHVHLIHVATRWGYGEEESRDLVQQFFLDLLQKNLDPAGILHPKTYLTRAFTHKLIDDHRKSKQQQSATLADTTAYEPSVLETLVRIQSNEELLASVKAAFKRLPARCQKVIHLKYYEGLTTEQIAERTGLNTRSVYNNLYEGIKTLREELKQSNPKMKFAAIFSLLPAL
ncbi:sigma-70 family RNA polymerase sigma factor [Chitinophaga sp. SYP-B3965]|uniref:RNA polymerase sigma factor n=1 Tax=Chitinophaga sp. SYP-B3965 TaxID=2663120 RepID=UPI001299C707|nr:sigma-70 family RNA polymerase sigma factor [Chitinophaga sp. SYP-B3965]MRG46023.1 sigma-70 family RNA polymerase sigma factor [Chitinophaga sp. SYP-B3965]